jgi:hypothetical protein
MNDNTLRPVMACALTASERADLAALWATQIRFASQCFYGNVPYFGISTQEKRAKNAPSNKVCAPVVTVALKSP